MLGFRTAGAAGGAALATVVGTGGAALVGIGLSMAAMYIYDKYISPNATSKPSDTPIAQVNIDNMSRPLTDIEKANGFTNQNGVGQGTTPPNTSTAYPKLWSGTGSATQPGQSGQQCSALGLVANQWVVGTNGIRYYARSPDAPNPSAGPGYATLGTLGFYCVINSIPHTIFTQDNPCALGYSGTNCTLQNPANVFLPSDGTCQILRTGNAFAIDPKDPDCVPQVGKSNPIPVFTASNGTLSFISKPDASGRPTVATVSVGNGQADVTVSTPNVSTPTYTNTQTTAAPPVAGTGNAPTTTSTTTNTSGVGPGAVVVTPTTTDVKVDLPENLAKTEDVAAVKNAIDSLKETPADPFNPNPGTVIPGDATDGVKTAIGDGSELPSVFSFSPTLPGSVNAPNIAFQLAGRTVSMDISAWIGYVRNFLGVLLYTVTPFVVFSVISGRRQED